MSESETQSGTEAITQVANLLRDGDKPAEEAVKEQPQGEPAASDDEPLGEGGKKALQNERDARKAAETKAAEFKAELDKIRAANMSDLERAQMEAQNAQEAAAKAVAEALRFRVAAQHGISAEDADLFLTGTDAETLQRQATRLKDRTPTTPKPDPTQGQQQAVALNSDELTNALERAVRR
jgi:hypothetical protein